MGFFSGGKSSYLNQSFQGLRNPHDETAFRVLLNRAPSDVNFLTSRLQDRIRGGDNILGLGSSGFMPQQTAVMQNLGQNLFGNLAGTYQGQNLLSQQNLDNTLGGAFQQASPQLMNLAAQNIMANEGLLSDRFGQLQRAMNLYPALLGQESTQRSSQTGPGLGRVLGESIMDSLGYGLGTSVKSMSGGGGGGGM